MQCQMKLTEGWNGAEASSEVCSRLSFRSSKLSLLIHYNIVYMQLVPFFAIAEQDKYSEFTLPNTLVRRSSSFHPLTIALDATLTFELLSFLPFPVRTNEGTRDHQSWLVFFAPPVLFVRLEPLR